MADCNNIQGFYEPLKALYGPRKRAIAPVRSADGSTHFKDHHEILARWANHFESLFNHTNPADPHILDNLPTSSSFGHLLSRVFENPNLKVSNKVAVYNAVCLSTLLYGAESWTPYRQHITNIEAFHIRCLQNILNLSREDRIPHTVILSNTDSICMEVAVAKKHLRWLGHTIRMPEHRRPAKSSIVN